MGASCGIVLTLGVADPAEAITYNFEKVTFSYDPDGAGSTIKGSFDYNGTAPSLLPGQTVAVDFAGTTPADVTFTSANTNVIYPATDTNPNTLAFAIAPTNTTFLFLNLSGPLLTTPNTPINLTGGYWCPSGDLASNCFANRRRFTSISGTVRSVPSPASAAVLAPLMALALYRKRFSKLAT
jgi:hypothetical protein